MSDSSDYSPDDQILAEFVLELERAGSRTVDTEPWINRYPHLSERFRNALRIQEQLDQSRPDEEPPLPEKLGEFRIVRRMGRGGMGDVYEAIQEPLDRRVAVKTIRHGHLSPDLRARFLREQKVLGRLHQTHIVPIHTAGQEGSLQYFTMPYIDGASLNYVIRTVKSIDSSQLGSRMPTLGQLAKLAIDHSTEPGVHTATHLFQGQVNKTISSHAEEKVLPHRRSRKYLQSVARVMADVADAVQHAHDVNILHRDLKPSNIMVDTNEQSWIIDFGLAGYISHPNNSSEITDDFSSDEPISSVNGFVGTPQYMAPEQFEGEPDIRSDVWSLGVTLYELLTMRRPFDGDSIDEVRHQVISEEPPPPRSLALGLPHELEAVCLKAMKKDPGQRYQTATEFGEDLRNFLRDEPTQALPPSPPQRVWKWSWRNKGWAAMISTNILVFIALSVGAILVQFFQVETAQEQERESRRQSRIQASQRIRLTPHFNGWRNEAWQAIREASTIQRDDTIRDHAAATLIGLDAHIAKHFPHPASSVTFSGDGNRLLLGGVGVWDSKTELFVQRFQGIPGPVNFSADGAVLQLMPKRARINERRPVWNLREYNLLSTSNDLEPRKFVIPRDDEQPQAESGDPPTMALSAAASYVAASPMLADDVGTLVVWDGATGKLLRQFDRQATSLAFSLDEKLFAAGDENGQITVWSLPDLKEVARIKSGRNKIHCLAFSKDRLRRDLPEGEPHPSTNWLLAAGDAGGSVAVWDLGTQSLRNRLYGGHYNIYAVAFSPDGTTLAAGGRWLSKLWDLSKGTLLLDLNLGDYITGIAFSPDGRQLAVSTALPENGRATYVWNLEYGRGIQTLRGLAAQISKTAFSPDGRLVAALAHDWLIGIWNVETGHLLHLLETPKGLFADNGAIAFSPDGRRLAFSTGSEARMWDLDSGNVLKRWKLPPGLVDVLAFDSQWQLFSFRMETADAQRMPDSSAHPNEFPRVSRIRRLPLQGRARLITEHKAHSWRVRTAAADLQGRYFVADRDQGPEAKGRTIQAYQTATGKLLWSIRVNSNSSEFLEIDSSGTILAAMTDTPKRTTLLEMPSGRLLESVPARLSYISRKANLLLTPSPRSLLRARQYGYSLFRRNAGKPVVSLDIDQPVISETPNSAPTAAGSSGATVMAQLPSAH